MAPPASGGVELSCCFSSSLWSRLPHGTVPKSNVGRSPWEAVLGTEGWNEAKASLGWQWLVQCTRATSVYHSVASFTCLPQIIFLDFLSVCLQIFVGTVIRHESDEREDAIATVVVNHGKRPSVTARKGQPRGVVVVELRE